MEEGKGDRDKEKGEKWQLRYVEIDKKITCRMSFHNLIIMSVRNG